MSPSWCRIILSQIMYIFIKIVVGKSFQKIDQLSFFQMNDFHFSFLYMKIKKVIF